MTCRKRFSCHVPLHTRMDETAPIDSAALFGSSFWVDDAKTGGLPSLWDQLGGYPETAQAASGMEAARSSIWLGRNSLGQATPQTPGGTAISVRHAYAVGRFIRCGSAMPMVDLYGT